MPTVTSRFARAVATVACALLLSAARALAGGAVMVVGHDADDHGFEATYADLYDLLLASTTNGSSGILAIGADAGSAAGNWITTVAGLMNTPQTVTFVNDAAISTASFSGFAIIHVPSTNIDTPGGINSTTEQPLLVARAVDIAGFINGGGSLFGLTQDSVTDAYGYLGLFAEITSVGVPASGDCGGGQQFDNITSTPAGQALGITDTNVDGCCWHNSFTSYPAFLQPLATVDEPGCTSPVIDGHAAMLGCLNCTLPGQMSLAPAVDLNPPGTSHTVTSTFLEGLAPNDPIVGVLTDYDVISGPNAGANGTDTTNVNGQASFTYTSNGSIGVDRIQAAAQDPSTLDIVTSNTAIKFWDEDCNSNSIPDTCDLDCNGFADDCLLFAGCGTSADANGNSVPDDCDECLTDADCDDGNVCTDDDCVLPAAQCTNIPNTAPCDDGLFCTATDVCAGGVCTGSGDPCPGQFCDEANDQCADCTANAQCDDGIACTVDTCTPGGTCASAPDDSLCPDTTCTNGVCNAISGCGSTPTNEGGPCDDGNSCTTNDVCIAGVCTGTSDTCGNGTVEPACGETCEPPGTLTCASDCTDAEFCRGPIPPPGVDCNDPLTPPELCDPCDLICFPGEQPTVRRAAGRIGFVSDENYTGTNIDGNDEIHIFDLKHFLRRKKKGAAQPVALIDSVVQITDTTVNGVSAIAVNEAPSFNASGRYLAFASNADVFGDGLSDDGNNEIFHHKLTVKKSKIIKTKITVDLQESNRITATAGVDNRNPNLRAFRGNLLIFDSPGDLVPDRCSGGDLDLELCTTNADCAGAVCGNPEGNREVFEWVRSESSGDTPLRQLTASPSGTSTVGQAGNFNTKATVFSSDADLIGQNPDGIGQIYRIIKKPENLVQISQLTDATTPGATASDPVQSRKPLATFISDADLTGANPLTLDQVFLWRESGAPAFTQITDTPSGLCEYDAPAIDGGGRYIALATNCDLLDSTVGITPTLFFFDVVRGGYVGFSVASPGGEPVANPIVTQRAKRAVFELLDQNDDPDAVCIFRIRKEHFEGPLTPP